jgi:hypothetical protein
VTKWLGLEFAEVRKGSAVLIGFSRELVEHFSHRREEIVDELERRGAHSLRAAQTAVLSTRKGQYYGVPIDRLREEWRARAAPPGAARAESAPAEAVRRGTLALGTAALVDGDRQCGAVGDAG